MFIIAPAWLFGLIAVFFVGMFATYAILDAVVKKQSGSAGLWRGDWAGFLDEKRQVGFSVVGGGLAVVLTIVLLARAPSAERKLIWYALIGLGFLFALVVSLLSATSRTGKTAGRGTPGPKPKRFPNGGHPKPQEQPFAEAKRDLRKERKNARARAADRRRCLSVLRTAVRTRTEHQIGSTLVGLGGFSARRERKSANSLSDALNGLFRQEHVSLKELFAPANETGGALPGRVEALLDIAGASFFVEVQRQKEPIDVRQVSNHLVRAAARDGTDAMLISSSGFAPPAISICRDALSRKTVVLIELSELVQLLERGRDLRNFLLAKIKAAVVEEEPLFRPLG